MSDPRDVQQLAKRLPCAVVQPISDDEDKWNHYDFLWSEDAKQLINEHIIRVVKETEIKSGINVASAAAAASVATATTSDIYAKDATITSLNL